MFLARLGAGDTQLLRPFITLLLIITLTITATGNFSLQQDEPPAQAEAYELTPEEEREAFALVEKFIVHMEKTQDVTPMIKELYVSDFPERLQQDDMGSLFPLALTPEVAAQATPDELQRVYAASINATHLGMTLYMAAYLKRKQAGRDVNVNAEEDEYTIAELVPPGVIKLIQSDPVLAKLLKKIAERTANALTQNEADAAPPAESCAEEKVSLIIEDLVPRDLRERPTQH